MTDDTQGNNIYASAYDDNDHRFLFQITDGVIEEENHRTSLQSVRRYGNYGGNVRRSAGGSRVLGGDSILQEYRIDYKESM